MSQAEKDLWKIKLKLKKGSHLLKFIVNGSDSVSDYMEKVLIDGRTYNIFQFESHSYEDSRKIITKHQDSARESLNMHDEVTDVDIHWKGTAKNVMVTGEFSNWSGISLAKNGELWSVKLKLKYGRYFMMFFVDGEIILSDDMEQVQCDDDEMYNVLNVQIIEPEPREINALDTNKAFKCNGIDTTEINSAMNYEINDGNVHENQTDFIQHDIHNLQKDFADDGTDYIDNNENIIEKQITWTGFANDVRVIGDFSNWTPINLSNIDGDIWRVNLKLKEGPHLIKFIIDKKFTLSEEIEKVIGPDHEIYNMIQVGSKNIQNYEIRYNNIFHDSTSIFFSLDMTVIVNKVAWLSLIMKRQKSMFLIHFQKTSLIQVIGLTLDIMLLLS